MDWIVIVDMGNIAKAIVSDEYGNLALFNCFKDIVNLKSEHPLGKFTWWAFNFRTGEVEEF